MKANEIVKVLNIMKNNRYEQFTIKTIKFFYYTKNMKTTTIRNYLRKLVKKGKLKKIDKFRYAFNSSEIKLSDFYTTNKRKFKRTNKVIKEVSKLTGIPISQLDNSLTEEYKEMLENWKWAKAKMIFEMENEFMEILK